MSDFGKLARRGTLKPEWIQAALKMGQRSARKERRYTTTVSVRLTDEEYEVLGRLCTLKKASRTGYLTRLATSQAKKDLLDHAVGEYLAIE